MKDARPTVYRIGLARAVFVSALVLGGCGSHDAPETAKSATATATLSASVPVVAQPDYCKRVCERATACGNESALAMKNLEPDAKVAVEKSAPETTRVCTEACAAEVATPVRLQLAERCNQEKDCGSFGKCLGDLGTELKK